METDEHYFFVFFKLIWLGERERETILNLKPSKWSIGTEQILNRRLNNAPSLEFTIDNTAKRYRLVIQVILVVSFVLLTESV